MRRAVLVGAALAVSGCVPPKYVQPELTAPHATVKLRVVHHDFPKTRCAGQFLANDHSLPTPAIDDPSQAATAAVRVEPEGLRMKYRATFTHPETRLVTQYRSESYACGTTHIGNSSMTQYCTRQVPYQTTQTVTVTDAACTANVAFTAVVGAMYLLEYDFYSNGHCSLKCFVQHPNADGTFALEPCRSRTDPP